MDASIRITAQPPLPELQISPAAAAGSELMFDDQFNYARYSELALFEGYRNDLLRASPPERLSLASWPATP